MKLTAIVDTDDKTSVMLKNSLLFEAEKQAHKKTFLKLDTATKHLCKFLDEFEGKWDSNEDCDSPEIALDYLDAAKFMLNHFGRVHNRIDAIQAWYDNYLPFGNR